MLDVPNVDNSSQNTLSLLRWWILPSLLLVTLCLGVIWRKSQPKEWEGFSVYHFHVRFQLDSVKKQIQSRCLRKSLEMISDYNAWTWRMFPRTIHSFIQHSIKITYWRPASQLHITLRSHIYMAHWLLLFNGIPELPTLH